MFEYPFIKGIHFGWCPNIILSHLATLNAVPKLSYHTIQNGKVFPCHSFTPYKHLVSQHNPLMPYKVNGILILFFDTNMVSQHFPLIPYSII